MTSKMNRNQQRKFICIQEKEKKEPRENSWFGVNSLKSPENFKAEKKAFKSCEQFESFYSYLGD